MNIPLLIFCLAERRILHFPLTHLWHSDRLILKFTNTDSSKGTASREITSFAIYGRSCAPFFWKNPSIKCPPKRERAISVQSSLGILFQWRSNGLNPLGLIYPSEIWCFFLHDRAVCLVPLGLILRAFPWVCVLGLSISSFFTKVNNGLVHFVKLCK